MGDKGEDKLELAEAEKDFIAYLEKTKEKEIRAILDGRIEQSSVYIHGQDLLNASYLLFIRAMADPLVYLPRLDALLTQAARRTLGQKAVVKDLRLRFSSLPAIPLFHRRSVPRSENAGQIIQFTGTVTKASQRRLLRWRKQLVCNKCQQSSPLLAEYDQFYEFPAEFATKCPTEDCPGFLGNEASPAPEDQRDIQDVKVQEQLRGLSLGSIPQSLWVTLEGELVGSVKPGDDVQVIGIVRRRWRPLGKGLEGKTDIELWLQALSVEVVNCRDSNWLAAEEAAVEFGKFWRQPGFADLAGRDAILSYFCPQVYGLHLVKLALAVVLAGGVERIDEGGTKVRGEAHILLVGDPGTAKSQLLRYCASLSPRSVLTTGVGSSSAGLTVAASRDGGDWHLEAGALVLADGGVCCIDEFNSIREADRTCIHEAMEQQSLSIAKAGMVTKLKTRCKVLAATNPKGQYDVNLSLSLNTAIASPLLSRFDIVLTMLDSHSEPWDKMVSSHLLEGRSMAPKAGPAAWSSEKLRGYFAHIQTLKPDLSSAASQVLAAYYRRQRKTDGAEQARTTVRLLQSCVRIAQGHARLMCRKEVSLQDAVVAVLLLESSTASSASLVHVTNPLHTTFPADPVEEYRMTAKKVLEALGLSGLWPEEAGRLQQVARRLKEGLEGEEQEVVPVQTTAPDYAQVVTRIQQSQAAPLPQVEVRQRGKKRRLGLRASKRPQNSEEKEMEATPGVNSSELNNGNSDGMSLGQENTEQAEDPSCTDSTTEAGSLINIPQCHTSGSEIQSLTKVKSKPLVVESSSNQLLEEEETPKRDQKQESEEQKDSGKAERSKPKLRRLNGTSKVAQVDQSKGKEGDEKGVGSVSSLTRKRLAEFRAPGQVGEVAEMQSEVVMNADIVENSLNVKKTEQIIKASKAGVDDQKMGKRVQKKSSNGNLLSFVTKMKFDTTKLNLNSDSDPFKQDDFDVDFDFDI